MCARLNDGLLLFLATQIAISNAVRFYFSLGVREGQNVRVPTSSGLRLSAKGKGVPCPTKAIRVSTVPFFTVVINKRKESLKNGKKRKDAEIDSLEKISICVLQK